MLLGHQRGCQTFADIRTIGGVLFPTYRAACDKLGLLENDDEWTYAFCDNWHKTSNFRTILLIIYYLQLCA
ncbi:hypothetical protein HanHA300_Chr03g0083301 [Helianthus annuus]|nr:hypothetical protein HanHA300_Chr03g0083301 [Helianthus annuus]KAJ0607276.1 hypothetical protein HanHA89_Chr03g0094801 [Helianthus annuus]KAJ0767336.1 hypothetical protein HanLR1_Chr03g0088101 [Helianthus annuus]